MTLARLPLDVAGRVRRRLRVLYTRTRLRFGMLDLEPGPVVVSKSYSHPFDARQGSLLTSTYRTRFADRVAPELAEARRLAAHEFTYLGHTATHGERIAWSLDPVSGREWSRGPSVDIPYRGAARLGDIKLPWELNKHQYFFTLGKAAWLSGEPAFAEEIRRQIDNWIEDQPCHRGVNWISALEVGSRAVSWILAYPFYADGGAAVFQQRLARSIAQHMMFVEQHLSVGPFANNHLIGDAAALVVGGLFLDCRHSSGWVDKGMRILEQQMLAQTTSDGVHVERSVSYHRFVLDQFYLVNALLERNGRTFSAATLAGMERMTAFLMDVLAPDGRAPSIGDGDDARGLWLHADCPLDFRSALGLGAVLFGRSDFKARSGGLPEEVLWLMGDEGVAAFDRVADLPPDHTSVAFLEGGYCVMRGGWQAPDAVLVFDCGPLGYGPARHGHADALSVHLHAAGYPFLIDPGAFSYNLDYAWRDAFRTTRAHNTIVVDDVDQSVTGDRMSWQTTATARPLKWVTTPWFDLADAEHDGYRRLANPVNHRRLVVFLKPDVWIVRDELSGKGLHRFELLWHLRPDCQVAIGQAPAATVLESPAGARLSAVVFDGAGSPCTPALLVGSDDERAAWFSPRYGERLPSRALSIRGDFEGALALTTLLSTSGDVHLTTTDHDGLVTFEVDRVGEVEELIQYGRGSGAAASPYFDGELLYRRRVRGDIPTVAAFGFRRLSIPQTIEVECDGLVTALHQHLGRCDIKVADGSSGDLTVKAAAGVSVTVNGKAW